MEAVEAAQAKFVDFSKSTLLYCIDDKHGATVVLFAVRALKEPSVVNNIKKCGLSVLGTKVRMHAVLQRSCTHGCV